jgi:hypothetical protein
MRVPPLRNREPGALDDGSTPPPIPSPTLRDDALERAAAAVRYQQFISRADPDPACHHPQALIHLLDGCSKKELKAPTVAGRQSGDAAAISPTDVQQGGGNGDCFLMAAIAALAATPRGQQRIGRSIAEQLDPSGHVTGYTVTLREPRWAPFGGRSYHEVRVAIDARFPSGAAEPRHPGSGDSTLGDEIWPLILEKACVQYKYAGSYAEASRGGHAADILPLLTGRPARHLKVDSEYGPAELQRDVNAGRLVVLDTRAEPADRSLRGAHAYAVLGIGEGDDHKRYVTLLDSWPAAGAPHKLVDVPLDDLRSSFQAVDVGELGEP